MDKLNVIEIKEQGNRLLIDAIYTPVVSGNSNYYLKFDFDSDWQECENKTAIFIVEGKKFAVNFTGDTVKVPPLPNATYFHIALTSAKDDDSILSTTALRLRLEPSPLAEDMSEFDVVKGYLPKLVGVINKIENGEIKAKYAEFADSVESATNASYALTSETAKSANSAAYATVAGSSETQVDLTSDQTINGLKNFADGIKVNNKDVDIDKLNSAADVLTDIDERLTAVSTKLNSTEQVDTIYDMSSSNSDINLGYTSGIQGSDSFNTIPNIDLSGTKIYRFSIDVLGNSGSAINFGAVGLVVEISTINLNDGEVGVNGLIPYYADGVLSDNPFRYIIRLKTNQIYFRGYFFGNGQDNNINYRIKKIERITQQGDSLW